MKNNSKDKKTEVYFNCIMTMTRIIIKRKLKWVNDVDFEYTFVLLMILPQ